jgi:DNA-binding MarR family transcriptional regulator
MSPRDPSKTDPRRAGDALRRLVDLVAHRSGAVLALMNDAAVTLPQVLLLSRAERLGSASLAELADESSASIPALSQMADRLVHQGWLDRAEDPVDRRRKAIRITARAGAFLRKLEAARSEDFDLGLRPVGPDVQAQLATALERAVSAIESAREDRRREWEVRS